MMSPFLGLFDDQLEVSQSGKWLVGVMMTVTDLLQNSAEDGMLHIQLGMRLTVPQ